MRLFKAVLKHRGDPNEKSLGYYIHRICVGRSCVCGGDDGVSHCFREPLA